ncbi:UNVERIFIED_CONTAM: hypothetical protein Sradi_3919100 [Sesamum radiatum]|uniref:Retrotransposon gag domain-containing protein n=1 Tax=Sesamum radiatum TaxID=300843 RepID=A0AAW2PER0_SESRA
MNTRSRARNGATGHEGFEGGGDVQNQHVGNVQGNPPAHGTLGEHTNDQREQGHGSFGAPPPPPLIQMTPEALRQLVEDASAQAANRAVARYAAEHGLPPTPHHHHGGRVPPFAPEDREQKTGGVQKGMNYEEEVNSRATQPEDNYYPPPRYDGNYFPHLQKKVCMRTTIFSPSPRRIPARGEREAQRGAGGRASPLGGYPNPMRRGMPVPPLAMAPPRRSPFAPHILAEAIQPGIKIPSLNEYNGGGDPQDHLDRFSARADLLDISDAAYCKLFRTTLSGKAMAWFNQLPPGTIESFEQLAQRFLHHFAINKRYPKTASYLFTIIQRENESLREYVQRFSEAVLEVPHVNPELLASIMQQNLKRGRFKESIAGKPPATQEELLMRAENNIRIEESTGSRPITPLKRRMNDDERIAPAQDNGKRDYKLIPVNTPLTSFSGDIVEPLGEKSRYPYPWGRIRNEPRSL